MATELLDEAEFNQASYGLLIANNAMLHVLLKNQAEILAHLKKTDPYAETSEFLDQLNMKLKEMNKRVMQKDFDPLGFSGLKSER